VQNWCGMLVARALKNSQLTRQPPGETKGFRRRYTSPQKSRVVKSGALIAG